MAEKFDVTARLGEGRGAVENVQNYVWATHLLGYQHPDLTLHAAQVRDWYGTEDGLDLRALDADGSALGAVATAAEEIVRLQRQQVDLLATAWSGDGADAATEFLRRHCELASSVAATARTAAEVLAGLRDNLWGIVDGKVMAVTQIDDRRQAERPSWLSAAQTVITSVGDRAGASELVDQHVKPFVDQDIGHDWLSAVGTAIGSVVKSYDAANEQLSPSSPGGFEIPGDLGPVWSPPTDETPSAPPRDGAGHGSTSSSDSVGGGVPAGPAVAAAAPATPPPMGAEVPAPAVGAMASPPLSATAPPAPALPASAPAGAMPSAPAGAMPELPGLPVDGLNTAGRGLADALGGLLPDDAGLPAPFEADPRDPAVPAIGEALSKGADASDDEITDGDTADEDAADPPREGGEEPGADGPGCDADEPEEPNVVEPDATPLPPHPFPAEQPAEPPPEPTAESPVEPKTPCEIAADQLPQVGQ